MQESRRCEFCHKREIDTPRKGGVTRFMGYWAHPSCFAKNKAKIPLPKPSLKSFRELQDQAEALLVGSKWPEEQ